VQPVRRIFWNASTVLSALASVACVVLWVESRSITHAVATTYSRRTVHIVLGGGYLRVNVAGDWPSPDACAAAATRAVPGVAGAAVQEDGDLRLLFRLAQRWRDISEELAGTLQQHPDAILFDWDPDRATRAVTAIDRRVGKRVAALTGPIGSGPPVILLSLPSSRSVAGIRIDRGQVRYPIRTGTWRVTYADVVNFTAVAIPCGWGVALFAALPISRGLIRAGRAALRAGQRHQGHCAICGYDLRATPTRCPECGAPANR
jgi:hypothetical protein